MYNAVASALRSGLLALENLSGVESVTAQGLRAFHIGQDEMVELSTEVSDIIAELVRNVNTAND